MVEELVDEADRLHGRACQAGERAGGGRIRAVSVGDHERAGEGQRVAGALVDHAVG